MEPEVPGFLFLSHWIRLDIIVVCFIISHFFGFHSEGEGLRLRCLSSSCELRPAAEQQALKEKLQELKESGRNEELGQDDEIAPDDREDQECNYFDEDDDDEEDLGNQDD